MSMSSDRGSIPLTSTNLGGYNLHGFPVLLDAIRDYGILNVTLWFWKLVNFPLFWHLMHIDNKKRLVLQFASASII